MKNILLTIIAAAFLFGCSDPESEANKLFTEASQLVKDADSLRDEDATVKRSAALSRLKKIQDQYPESSVSVMVSQGDIKISGQTLEEIESGIKEDFSFSYAVGRQYNLDLIKKHLAAGTDPSISGKSGGFPLQVALDWREGTEREIVVKMILEHGANINSVFGEYWETSTPLLMAITNVDIELVKFLLKNGANVNQKDPINNKLPMDRVESLSHFFKLPKETQEKTWVFKNITSEELLIEVQNISDLLRKHGGKRAEELKAQGK